MNQGATLDEIVHAVRVDDDLIRRPWLRPIYDEPEFVVRNVWRLYGGWWDGDPAHLKPPTASSLAHEVADLAGGADALAARAQQVSEAGDHRLACQLIELAAAASADPGVWRLRSALYLARAEPGVEPHGQGRLHRGRPLRLRARRRPDASPRTAHRRSSVGPGLRLAATAAAEVLAVACGRWRRSEGIRAGAPRSRCWTA